MTRVSTRLRRSGGQLVVRQHPHDPAATAAPPAVADANMTIMAPRGSSTEIVIRRARGLSSTHRPRGGPPDDIHRHPVPFCSMPPSVTGRGPFFVTIMPTGGGDLSILGDGEA